VLPRTETFDFFFVIITATLSQQEMADTEVKAISQNATGVNVQTANKTVDLDVTGEPAVVANIPELENVSDNVDDTPTQSAPSVVDKVEATAKEVVETVKAIENADKEAAKAAAVEDKATKEALKADAAAKQAELAKKKAEEEKAKAEAAKKKAEMEKKEAEAEKKALEVAKKKAEEEKAKAEAAKKKAEEEKAKAEAAKKKAEEEAKKKAAAEAKKKALMEQMDPMSMSVKAEYQGVCVGWVKSSNAANAPMVMAACAKTKENTCPAVFNDSTCTMLQPINAKVGQDAKMMMF
jgi:colicin import membrane protein